MKVFLSDEVKKAGFGLFGDVEIDAKSVPGNGWIVEADKGGGSNINVAEGSVSVSRKRKRKCYLGMLRWIREVGKDPCDACVEAMPEKHKWKCYEAEMEWKQILLVREGMLLKKNRAEISQPSVWKKKLKMHPSMYDEDQYFSKLLRFSKRLVSESSSSTLHIDVDIRDTSTVNSINFCGNKHRMKRVPTSPNFHAELPGLCGEVHYESNPKWLGTKIWPHGKSEQKKCLIKRDPIGKGEWESCSCRFMGSVECVQSHVREKRVKLKLELGSAYYKWKFDSMGEIVRLSWAKEDECKFQEIMVSSGRYLWDKLFRHFDKKDRETLVSYYFNVLLLRRIGTQSRSGRGSFECDDEDSECCPIGDKSSC